MTPLRSTGGACAGTATWQERLEALAGGDLVQILWSIDQGETYGHCVRVGLLSQVVARQLGLPETHLAYEGGLHHDLGKIAVPPAVLLKPGPLDAEERLLVELHAAESERLLRAFGRPALAQIVGEHHENLDGSGYPYGRSGESLSPLGQAIAVADVYDALTFDRPYRAALSRAKALEIVRAMGGTRFSQRVISALETAIQEPEVEQSIRLLGALAMLPENSLRPGQGKGPW